MITLLKPNRILKPFHSDKTLKNNPVMKLTLTLLAVASSVSASTYMLCCCTQPTLPQELPDRRYYVDDPKSRFSYQPIKQCSHAATQGVVDSSYSHFAFTTHFWEGTKGNPRFKGQDYIYATAINGDDNKIGQAEMAGLCRKYDAGRYCWTPDGSFRYNYQGLTHNPNGIN